MSKRFDQQAIDKFAKQFEAQSAQDVLSWALETFHPRLALASSFGAEDVVVIDLLMRLNPHARVFTLDTGRLNQETYDVMDAIRKKYHLAIEVYFPQTEAVERMVRERGLNCFYDSVENRKLCCGIRKVEPLNRALITVDAWMTGLRRGQAVTRTATPKVERDDAHGGLVKLNPLADWTDTQVWDYIRAHQVPYNALHDRGYPSIGCEPCTRAVKPGEDLRAGRWWWERPEQKECGLHVKDVHAKAV